MTFEGMRGAGELTPVRVLVLTASLRSESLNTCLARLAAVTLQANGCDVDFASMAEFDAPSYNEYVEASSGFPPGAHEFRRRLELTDAFVIASPEYNASFPGVLKNAIDWVSRFRPQPFNEHHCLLMSASPSMSGGNRGLWALRVPLEHLGTRVYPDMFSPRTRTYGARSRRTDREPAAPESLRGEQHGLHGFGRSIEALRVRQACLDRVSLPESPDPMFDRVQSR